MKKLSRENLKMIKGSGDLACSVDLRCPPKHVCCNRVCLKTTEIVHLPICEEI
ncbi:hypothetical protein [Chryseobacterium sp. OSA05B]|uniref:hypothetical protein n=1 Tax=Chryseobacterium sp. OSA05B TaxID=2862650 RepID=UPI001CBEB051|nr:hypothetical protein [Chryseobacterium sp. OSA05B]